MQPQYPPFFLQILLRPNMLTYKSKYTLAVTLGVRAWFRSRFLVLLIVCAWTTLPLATAIPLAKVRPLSTNERLLTVLDLTVAPSSL